MIPKAVIDEFLGQQALAFVGVSRSPKKFANIAFRELRKAGYRLFPVHPEMPVFDGIGCHRRLADIPEKVGGVVVMVGPDRAEAVAREAAAAGIRRIWFQQQGASESAIRAGAELGVQVVHGECILMFMPRTAGFHRFHRFVRGLFGRLPK